MAEDADTVDRWLNLLEGYFSVHEFFNRENITFSLLKSAPHVKDWWETYYERKDEEEPVAGISPLLQDRNGYLLSIGWKDRFPYGNA